MQAEQEGLLAGKYKDAKDLENAYLELQKKLGSQEDAVQEDQETTEEVKEEEEPKAEETPAVALLTEATKEYYDNNNTLSAETIEKFSEMSSQDLVSAYLEMQKNAPPQAEGPDVSEAQINTIQNSVGGQKEYDKIVKWASTNLEQTEVDAFDSLVASGNIDAIKLGVSALQSKYRDANGYEGRMLSGKKADSRGDVFRSQAELVAAMSDPKYDNDPAYRADLIEKLDRSDVNF
tara:strand:- start:1134 stop:1835 length:702 start_codon:yes stop_codon:yes gene_type:complete